MTIPFQLRGHSGKVLIDYGTNRDPARWGFDLLNLPFDTKTTIGFPVFDATVEYEARGYRALMGWIQLVTVHDTKTGQESTTIDQLPILRESDLPFFEIGVSPGAFDAPGPNPPRTDETWTAHTFLVFCPDVGRTRRVKALVGVRWGHVLTDGHANPRPLERVSLSEWTRLAPVLRTTYPRWEFLTEDTSP
jgi:hypothetical protein